MKTFKRCNLVALSLARHLVCATDNRNRDSRRNGRTLNLNSPRSATRKTTARRPLSLSQDSRRQQSQKSFDFKNERYPWHEPGLVGQMAGQPSAGRRR